MTQAGQFCTLQIKSLQKINDESIQNAQHGIRAQMVLKLTNKLQMAEIETDSLIDVQKWKG